MKKLWKLLLAIRDVWDDWGWTAFWLIPIVSLIVGRPL
jgi:hypothetical protein